MTVDTVKYFLSDYLSAAINKFAVEAAKFDEEVRKLPDSGAE